MLRACFALWLCVFGLELRAVFGIVGGCCGSVGIACGHGRDVEEVTFF